MSDEAYEAVESDAVNLTLRFPPECKPRKIAGAVSRRFQREFDLLAITVEHARGTHTIPRALWFILGVDAVESVLAN